MVMMMKKILNLKNLSIIAILLIFVYTLVSQEIKLREQRAEMKNLKTINTNLEKECIYYEKQKDNIQEDSSVTKEMREKLKFIKDGEIMIIDRNEREE